MRTRRLLLTVSATFVLTLTGTAGSGGPTTQDPHTPLLHAQTITGAALTGQVTSPDAGAMEGVLVSAKKPGSTITVTVVSDAQGRYQFPASKLAPGAYALDRKSVV